jgi:pyruvate/2-oxoglutarate dehydrogenase complex dihydrolipoamide acyltransferase (E2) component
MSILEMKVPSPGESITEVEIATWLVKDGDYVEKDQPIAEVDSDKATLELPAEQSGIITLKAEEGEVVQVGQVVCLIDMDAAKPEGALFLLLSNLKKNQKQKLKEEPAPAKVEAAKTESYASQSPSPAAKKSLMKKESMHLRFLVQVEMVESQKMMLNSFCSCNGKCSCGWKQSSDHYKTFSSKKKIGCKIGFCEE